MTEQTVNLPITGMTCANCAVNIELLHKHKLRVIMLTGDSHQTAQSIASEVNIDDIFAEVRPEEKSSKIRELQDKEHQVGMVGDGINDAPALAQTDVGLAIGTGTDVAIETGDVILSSGSLIGISRAIKVSRQTISTVKQNLFLAFVYNVVLIPLAAGVLAPFVVFGFLVHMPHKRDVRPNFLQFEHETKTIVHMLHLVW